MHTDIITKCCKNLLYYLLN